MEKDYEKPCKLGSVEGCYKFSEKIRYNSDEDINEALQIIEGNCNRVIDMTEAERSCFAYKRIKEIKGIK